MINNHFSTIGTRNYFVISPGSNVVVNIGSPSLNKPEKIAPTVIIRKEIMTSSRK